MNKQKKDNTNIIQWAIPALLLVLFLIITLLNYSATMRNDAKEKVMSKLESQAESLCEYYEDTLTSLTNIAEITAEYCSISSDVFQTNNIALLSDIVKQTGVKKAYIQKLDNSAVDESGNTYVKISNKSEYLDILSDSSQVTKVIQDEDGENVLLVTAPIKNSSEILGKLILVYKPDKLEEVVSRPDYLLKNTYALVSDEGKVIECVGKETGLFSIGDNLFTKFEEVSFLDGSLKYLTQNISNQKSGEAKIRKNEEIEKYVVYAPVGEYHSSIVIFLNHDQVEKTISEECKSTRTLMYKIGSSFVVFILIILMINIVSRTKYINENRELQSKAETDLLTDLLNKVATEKKIKEYLQNEGKGKTSIMFVLDIDNFKKINDTMGHAFGDEVLRTLGKQIRAEFRVDDIIGRTGGDEFTILLKDLNDDATMKREAKRVAQFFKNFKVGEYTKYFATASIGAAIYPKDASDFESLYKASDQALYKAKKRGKNQLAFYSDAE